MTTITRIKGVIDNPELPVIIAGGLENFYYGKFVNGLDKQGYYMTTAQQNAVKDFINYLQDNELIEYIQTIFPLIGNSTNVNAAKVPIIGDKLLDFPVDFSGFTFDSSNNIVGIDSMPAINSVKMSDVQPNDALFGAAVSLNKDATPSFDFYARIFDFDGSYHLRYQKYNNKEYFAIYGRGDGTLQLCITTNDQLDKTAAGSAYAMAIYESPDGQYVRYMNFNEATASLSGSSSSRKPTPTSADLAKTITASSAVSPVTAWTSFTFFNKMMTKSQSVLYMQGLKTFIEALGKNI